MTDVQPPIPDEAIGRLEELLGRSLEGWDRCPPAYSSPRPAVEGAWFDPKAVVKVIEAFRLLPHTKGRWARSPFEPEPWQVVWMLAPIFGWKHPNGSRIVRTAWDEWPRKNGKSSVSSRLGVVLLTADGELGAEVYAAATTEPQARIIYDDARNVVLRAHALKGRVEPLTSVIRVPSTGGIFRALSKVAEAAHGLNVSGAVVDEVHLHKKRDLIDAIETGTGAREQPLVVFITTAGDGDETTIYAEKHNYAVKIANGDIVDPTFYVGIWAADPDDDPFVEDTWRRANPNLGVSVSLEYLAKEAARARETPTYLPTFKRLHLNIRATAAAQAWPGTEAWPLGTQLVTLDKLAGKPVWAGLVCASASDLSAIALAFRNPEKEGWWGAWRWFLPGESLENLNRRTDGHSQQWVDDGRLELTEGNVIDVERHAEVIRELAKTYDLRELAYDPNGAVGVISPLVAELDDRLVPIYVTNPGSALLDWERLLKAKEFFHGGDPIASWQVQHVRVKESSTSVLKLDRRDSLENVFGIAAMDLALRRALLAQEPTSSVYETRGLRSF